MKKCNEVNRDLKALLGRVAVLEATMKAVIDSLVADVQIPTTLPLTFRPEDIQIENEDLPPFR